MGLNSYDSMDNGYNIKSNRANEVGVISLETMPQDTAYPRVWIHAPIECGEKSLVTAKSFPEANRPRTP